MVEIAATEATLRFLSGIFYSLIVSMLILTLVLLATDFSEFNRSLALIPIALYAICLAVITFNYRFYRVKEVEILFDATYQNKDVFLNQE